LVAQPSADDVARLVRDRYGERASTPVLLGAGEWSQAYSFRVDRRELVIRLGAHREDFAKDARMGDAGFADLHVPRVVEIGDTRWGYFAVSERARGEFLDALDGPQMRAVLPRLFALLDAIRGVDLAGTTGYGGWSSDGRGSHSSWPAALLAINDDRPRIGNWRDELERSSVGTESFTLGYAKLAELVGGLPNHRQLIHGDLLNHNVLVAGNRITAVLDWGNAMYGDALFEAAWLVYWWPWHPQWAAIDIEGALRDHWARQGTPTPDLSRRLLAYQLFIGLDHLAYNASTHRWADLSWNDKQVRALLSGA
jgi:hygromycin-B 4-O-kinase